MGTGLDMRHFWPSDYARYIIAKKKTAVPPRCISGTITAFAGSYITLRDYQTSPSITCPELSRRNPPTAHPLKRIKAVKGKRWLRVIQPSFGKKTQKAIYNLCYIKYNVIHREVKVMSRSITIRLTPMRERIPI